MRPALARHPARHRPASHLHCRNRGAMRRLVSESAGSAAPTLTSLASNSTPLCTGAFAPGSTEITGRFPYHLGRSPKSDDPAAVWSGVLAPSGNGTDDVATASTHHGINTLRRRRVAFRIPTSSAADRRRIVFPHGARQSRCPVRPPSNAAAIGCALANHESGRPFATMTVSAQRGVNRCTPHSSTYT